MDKVILDLFRSIFKLLKVKVRWSILYYYKRKILFSLFREMDYVALSINLLKTTDAVTWFFKCEKDRSIASECPVFQVESMTRLLMQTKKNRGTSRTEYRVWLQTIWRPTYLFSKKKNWPVFHNFHRQSAFLNSAENLYTNLCQVPLASQENTSCF